MQRDNAFSLFSRRSGARLSPRGQELDSLAEANVLRGRFFSWRGVSGQRYVCSVFQRGEEGFVSDVESGVIIGVTRDGVGLRPVCVLAAREGRQSLRHLARELGVAEWHVHFCEGNKAARDLSTSLLS
ncbi:MAG: hypothetical protein ACR652_04695 [Methylocystis sp.]|uniref:hypothetical protein n=1 Tax=Methylocystis sp. TaxID=1911079 RepID=UPI003DA59C51